jgi:hypothetical protein
MNVLNTDPDLTPSRVAALECPARFHHEHVLRRRGPSAWNRKVAFANADKAESFAVEQPAAKRSRAAKQAACGGSARQMQDWSG